MKTILKASRIPGIASLILVAMGTPQAAQAQDFDLRGFRLHMTPEEFLPLAESMVDNSASIRRAERILLTSASEKIPETAHVSKYTFQDTQGDRWTITVTRPPQEVEAVEIIRYVTYGTCNRNQCKTDGNSLETYVNALKEKYGEPMRERTSSKTEHAMFFAQDPLSEGCAKAITPRHPPQAIPNISVSSIPKTEAQLEQIADCPGMLSVNLKYSPHIGNPVVTARFSLVDYYAASHDIKAFNDYWVPWIDEYVQRKAADKLATEQGPAL